MFERLARNLIRTPARTAASLRRRVDPDFRLAWRLDPLLRTLRPDPAAPPRRRVHLDGLDHDAAPGPLDAEVLLLGWYGNETTGDQAILGGILRRLDPPRVWQTTSDHRVSRATLDAIGFREVRLIDDDPAAIAEVLPRVDAVLIAGGPIKEGDITRQWADTFAAAARLGKARMIYGCGVGPIKSPRSAAAVRRLFALADVATLRDGESLDLAQRLGADTDTTRVAADPAVAFHVDAPPAGPPPADGPVGVSFRYLPRDYHVPAGGRSAERVEADALAAYVALVDHIHTHHGRDVVLVPMQLDGPRNDRVLLTTLQEKLAQPHRAALLDYEGPYALTAALRGLSFMVGMRFHSVLMSWLAGVPTLGVDYDMHGGKVTSLLRQMGTPGPGLLIHLADLTGPRLIERFDTAWPDREWISCKQEDNLYETQSCELCSVKLLNRLLPK